MSDPKTQEKIARALAAAERHRPIRRAWADRFVEEGKMGRLSTFRSICLLGVPFVFITALSVISFASSPESSLSKSAGWWLSSALVLLYLAVLVAAYFLSNAVLKRSSLPVNAIEARVLLSFLPGCPRLTSIVRGWAVESGDAALSAYEYSLIYRVASAMELQVGQRPSIPAICLELNEAFYETFPLAPRFPGPPGDPPMFSDKRKYIEHVEFLNSAVGHVEPARARRRQERLGSVLSAPAERSLRSASRL